MMTQTTLNGIYCIRFVAGATRTTVVHVHAAYDIVCKEAETALEMWAQTSGARLEPVLMLLQQFLSSDLTLVQMPRSRSLSPASQDA